MIPQRAEAYIDGLYYRIGVHAKAFFWSGDEWLLSDKDAAVITREISRKMEREKLYGVSRFSPEAGV